MDVVEDVAMKRGTEEDIVVEQEEDENDDECEDEDDDEEADDPDDDQVMSTTFETNGNSSDLPARDLSNFRRQWEVAPDDDGALSSFRKQWEQELQSDEPSPTVGLSSSKSSQPPSTSTGASNVADLQSKIESVEANNQSDGIYDNQQSKEVAVHIEVAHDRYTGNDDDEDNDDSLERPAVLHDEAATLEFKRQKDEIDEALRIHFMAEQLEARGTTFEALKLYRKAEKLDPHVEKRAHGVRLARYYADKANEPTADTVAGESESGKQDDEGIVHIEDLAEHFKHMDITWQALDEDRLNPFSILPQELFLKVLVDVLVVSRMDVAKILRLSRVCRSFFIGLQNNDLWRMVVKKLWKGRKRRGNFEETSEYLSLRDECIRAPRVLFHGIYISAHRYHRRGEQRMEFGFHTPQHTVEYYRYVRFFPDGKVIALTSTTPPEKMVPMLKHPRAFTPQEARMSTGFFHYTSDGKVQLDLNSATKENYTRTTIQINLEILNRKKSFSTKLAWEGYAATQLRDGCENATSYFNLKEFLPYIFSAVKTLA